ncbi:hypothetical protein BDW62DRAFT_177888 [Aspergillus aurantiobrunneus]
MGQGDRTISTKTNPDRIRNPDKPASSCKLKRAPAQLGFLADTPGPATSSTPSTASASRSGKRKSVRDQPTLTQIDFVTVSQQPESDGELDFIDNSEKNTHEVIEIEDEKEEQEHNGCDAEYRPPATSRAKRERRVRIGPAHSKPRKTSINGEGTLGKGRRKSGDKEDKGSLKDDKTLTQMNYVQRVLVEPENDVKLEYAYITPKNRDSKRQRASTNNDNEYLQQPAYVSESVSQQKRIKLSPGSEGKVLDEADDNLEKFARPSTTPRKPARTEIPSSQSPESPGVAFITASQFRSATRSPQKGAFETHNEAHVKTESPGSDKLAGSPEIAQTHSSPNNPNSPPSPPTRRVAAEQMPEAGKPMEFAGEALAEISDCNQRPGLPQRTVVYETDAESDYGDSQDDLLNVPSSPIDKDTADSKHGSHENEPNSPNAESQELPPLPIPEQETDSGPLPSESNLLSDASICYQRLHPATQFPLEPVPTINTQKMAELFPENSNGLHTLTPSPSSSPMKTRPPPDPRLMTETQDPSQDQHESQDAHKAPTEVVPESSPVARHEGSATVNRGVPTDGDAVVQVESSQPLDRIHKQRTTEHYSRPRGMLSRNQILTSSVMESIPIPALWMSSQDSVGEPYSLPDT